MLILEIHKPNSRAVRKMLLRLLRMFMSRTKKSFPLVNVLPFSLCWNRHFLIPVILLITSRIFRYTNCRYCVYWGVGFSFPFSGMILFHLDRLFGFTAHWIMKNRNLFWICYSPPGMCLFRDSYKRIDACLQATYTCVIWPHLLGSQSRL